MRVAFLADTVSALVLLGHSSEYDGLHHFRSIYLDGKATFLSNKHCRRKVAPIVGTSRKLNRRLHGVVFGLLKKNFTGTIQLPTSEKKWAGMVATHCPEGLYSVEIVMHRCQVIREMDHSPARWRGLRHTQNSKDGSLANRQCDPGDFFTHSRWWARLIRTNVLKGQFSGPEVGIQRFSSGENGSGFDATRPLDVFSRWGSFRPA